MIMKLTNQPYAPKWEQEERKKKTLSKLHCKAKLLAM
jgi:hypothetical protein